MAVRIYKLPENTDQHRNKDSNDRPTESVASIDVPIISKIVVPLIVLGHFDVATNFGRNIVPDETLEECARHVHACGDAGGRPNISRGDPAGVRDPLDIWVVALLVQM